MSGSSNAVVLRSVMVRWPEAGKVALSMTIARALCRIGRHRFLPEATIAAAADQWVIAGSDERAVPVAVDRAPVLMSRQLALLQAQPGNRLLEFGSRGGGTALLSVLVRRWWQVTSGDRDGNRIAVVQGFGFAAVADPYPVGPDGPMRSPTWRPVRP